mmetsp:Transcript_163418/g.524009  ORF Transcript_163418/g.524009 Transcript_163418/m.524009 type:complete len:408 (+) Transcript_163418:77-1300(+)
MPPRLGPQFSSAAPVRALGRAALVLVLPVVLRLFPGGLHPGGVRKCCGADSIERGSPTFAGWLRPAARPLLCGGRSGQEGLGERRESRVAMFQGIASNKGGTMWTPSSMTQGGSKTRAPQMWRHSPFGEWWVNDGSDIKRSRLGEDWMKKMPKDQFLILKLLKSPDEKTRLMGMDKLFDKMKDNIIDIIDGEAVYNWQHGRFTNEFDNEFKVHDQIKEALFDCTFDDNDMVRWEAGNIWKFLTEALPYDTDVYLSRIARVMNQSKWEPVTKVHAAEAFARIGEAGRMWTDHIVEGWKHKDPRVRFACLEAVAQMGETEIKKQFLFPEWEVFRFPGQTVPKRHVKIREPYECVLANDPCEEIRQAYRIVLDKLTPDLPLWRTQKNDDDRRKINTRKRNGTWKPKKAIW